MNCSRAFAMLRLLRTTAACLFLVVAATPSASAQSCITPTAQRIVWNAAQWKIAADARGVALAPTDAERLTQLHRQLNLWIRFISLQDTEVRDVLVRADVNQALLTAYGDLLGNWITEAESIKPPTCIPDDLRINLALSRYLTYQLLGDTALLPAVREAIATAGSSGAPPMVVFWTEYLKALVAIRSKDSSAVGFTESAASRIFVEVIALFRVDLTDPTREARQVPVGGNPCVIVSPNLRESFPFVNAALYALIVDRAQIEARLELPAYMGFYVDALTRRPICADERQILQQSLLELSAQINDPDSDPLNLSFAVRTLLLWREGVSPAKDAISPLSGPKRSAKDRTVARATPDFKRAGEFVGHFAAETSGMGRMATTIKGRSRTAFERLSGLSEVLAKVAESAGPSGMHEAERIESNFANMTALLPGSLEEATKLFDSIAKIPSEQLSAPANRFSDEAQRTKALRRHHLRITLFASWAHRYFRQAALPSVGAARAQFASESLLAEYLTWYKSAYTSKPIEFHDPASLRTYGELAMDYARLQYANYRQRGDANIRHQAALWGMEALKAVPIDYAWTIEFFRMLDDMGLPEFAADNVLPFLNDYALWWGKAESKGEGPAAVNQYLGDLGEVLRKADSLPACRAMAIPPPPVASKTKKRQTQSVDVREPAVQGMPVCEDLLVRDASLRKQSELLIQALRGLEEGGARGAGIASTGHASPVFLMDCLRVFKETALRTLNVREVKGSPT